jgi:arginyl-tRNA synthetase
MSPIITEGDALAGVLGRIAGALERAAAALVPGDGPPAVAFEAPRNPDFGDFSSNVALQLAKRARRPPQQLAAELIARVLDDEPSIREVLAEATALGGFINVRLAPPVWRQSVATILTAGSDYGRGAPNGQHVSLEFGSANPTGPLVVVQGRTLSLGDSLAKTLRFFGTDVTTEWIINDAGSQLETLGRSVYSRYRQLADPSFPFPEDGYPGEYLVAIAERVRAHDGARWETVPQDDWLPFFGAHSRDELVHEQQGIAARFGVTFDRWQSERVLHESGAIERGIEALRERGLIFEEDGALWVRTTQFGDDKDRVIVRGDGRPTYFGADVAYHWDKLQRAERAILILGPDHHGYIERLGTIAAAFGRPGAIEVLIAQQITLVRDGEIVAMSKRAGNVVTLDEILDEIGVDAARFFFVLTNPDSPMTFDLSLAKEQSNENPVFYVQYGHARIASIERRADPTLRERAERGEGLERLVEPSELALARRLSEFPAIVRAVAENLAPQRLPRYAREVAAEFHQFYMNCRVLTDDAELSVARLGLSRATKIVLANALMLLGVSAPDAMERAEAE